MTLDKNFGEELLHKIKDEKLQPKPRWQFLLKNYVVWGIGALALFLGSVSMSLIFYMSRYTDPGLYNRAGGKPWEILFLVIPFFWIICLALFIFVVLYNIKHTKKGYRYSLSVMLAGIIGASVVIGAILYAVGFGEKVDDELGRRVPFYDHVINPHVDFWSRPANGRLTGMVISQVNDNEYVLIDRDRNEWNIIISNLEPHSKAGIKIGKPTRLLGKIEAEKKFKVAEIMSMMPGKGFFADLEPGPRVPLLPKNIENSEKCSPVMSLGNENNFNFLLEKYPEFKIMFIDNLLANKNQIKNIMGRDPEFIKHLESFNIGTDTIIKLQQ